MDENNEIKKINDDLEEISQDEQLRKEAEFWRMNAVYLDWDKKTAFAEGEKKGIKQGAKNEKIEIAKNMLNKKLDINLITELTGLSKDEIENLK